MIDDILKFVQKDTKYVIGLVIAILGLGFSFWRLVLYIKKTRIDIIDSRNRKANFSLYLEDCYRLNLENSKKYLLFNLRIKNHSTSKHTVIASIEIKYADKVVKRKHQNELFALIPHQNLTGLHSNINLNEKEIKSGWLIFDYPKSINDIRIEQFVIKVKDSDENVSEISTVIIKDVIYEH